MWKRRRALFLQEVLGQEVCFGRSRPHPPRAQRLKEFNLDRNVQSRLKISIFKLENFNPDLQNSPQKIEVWWGVRLKFSIFKLESFNPDL